MFLQFNKTGENLSPNSERWFRAFFLFPYVHINKVHKYTYNYRRIDITDVRYRESRIDWLYCIYWSMYLMIQHSSHIVLDRSTTIDLYNKYTVVFTIRHVYSCAPVITNIVGTKLALSMVMTHIDHWCHRWQTYLRLVQSGL